MLSLALAVVEYIFVSYYVISLRLIIRGYARTSQYIGDRQFMMTGFIIKNLGKTTVEVNTIFEKEKTSLPWIIRSLRVKVLGHVTEQKHAHLCAWPIEQKVL